MDKLDLRPAKLVLWAPPVFYCLCHTIHHSIAIWDALGCSSIILNMRSFSTQFNCKVLEHRDYTSSVFHVSPQYWQNVSIILQFRLLYLFYIPILFVYLFTEHCSVCPAPSPGSLCQALPSSECTWCLVWIAHVSLIPHYLVSWIVTVMPYFSYYSYSILMFLRGVIIYYPVLCFSVSNKISGLLIQGLKTNIFFLRLLKVGETG